MVMSMSGSDSAATYGSVSLGIVHIRKPVKLQHLEQNFPQFWGVPPTVPLYKLSSSTKPELNNWHQIGKMEVIKVMEYKIKAWSDPGF